MTVQTPLDQVAHEINVRLDKADEIDGKARDHRLAAALLLKEARERLPRGEWGKWLVANIRRSRQDVYRCLALVKSDDPAKQRQARERQQAQVREQVQRSRAVPPNVTYVCDKPLAPEPTQATNPLDAIKGVAATLVDPLDVIKALILDLDTADFERCKAWFLAYAGAVTSPQAKTPEQRSTALAEAPAAAPEAINNGGPTKAPTVSADEIGLEDTMPPQGEGPEDNPASPPDPRGLVSPPVPEASAAPAASPLIDPEPADDDDPLIAAFKGSDEQAAIRQWVLHGRPLGHPAPVGASDFCELFDAATEDEQRAFCAWVMKLPLRAMAWAA